jgi:hypothetical protein
MRIKIEAVRVGDEVAKGQGEMEIFQVLEVVRPPA